MLNGIKPLCLALLLLLSACHSEPVRPPPHDATASAPIDPTKSLFPLGNYSQSVDKWLPSGPQRQVAVLDPAAQQRHFSALKSHYFGMGPNEESPWNPHYIVSVLSREAESHRDAAMDKYLGNDSVSWGENFRTHAERWKRQVRNNASTDIDPVYHPTHRGIAVRETLVRMLPTNDPAYDDPRLAGQGYPFDNLQDSSIRPGTPVYVMTESRDKRWKYVISPTVLGWVHGEDIAAVDRRFVTEWLALAGKNLGAFIQQPVSVQEGELFYFTARHGTVLPFYRHRQGVFSVAVPVRREDGRAQIRRIDLKAGEFAAMPWRMTPDHLATLMRSMIGRPYGWGNDNFNNDCSAELRSLLMPFGVFLPRNSAAQIEAASRVVDLSQANTDERLRYLKEHGKPFTTLVYIPGHIMLYIGNAAINGRSVPMTYQNIWGLRPADSKRRSIIGGAVFFPLLATYPEDPELTSLAGKAQFKLGFIE
ncbi:cell wall-associated hydrolase [Serratia marcescens]|nr:cell wall-associated hydrolase [Serratia marcescens]BEM77790.1 cell wall-associated hydrolase [Serratia marcescens]